MTNQTFKQYVTSSAFNLSLSKGMILRLIGTSQGRYIPAKEFRSIAGNDSSVTSGSALQRRGLVYSPDPEYPGIYKLTRAGELVLELLIEAGAVNETH